MMTWASGRLICLHLLVALFLSSLGLILAADQEVLAQTASAIDCSEFIDQAEAQRFYEVKGGPSFDPYFLDADQDGLACEPGPPPTPISQQHFSLCEQWEDALPDLQPADGGARYRSDCADYLKQTGRAYRCPAYEGLSYRFFSALSPDQARELSDTQESEYASIMSYAEGDCVPVDVAKTSAWQCQPLPYYIGEFEQGIGQFMGDRSYYTQQLTNRYRVVCLGADAKIRESRQFSKEYLGAAALVGAAVVILYGRYRKKAEVDDH